MDKISIIIPVYNVEPYIRKCLDSVIGQTHKNLEILLINDGSSDAGGKICDEYAAGDSRLKVFHQANGGLSAALNVGLSNFTGDYLGFVDSDDWIEPDMFETLYKSAKKENVPVSVVGYFKDTDSESMAMTNKLNIPDGVISVRNMLLYPLKRDDYLGFCSYVWNKLYSAGIIRSSGIKFDEKIRYGMDVIFYYSLVLSAKCTCTYTNKQMYHYFQRSAAISKTKSVSTKSDILTAYKSIEKLMDNSDYSDISYWARGFYCHHAIVVAEIAHEADDIYTFRKMQSEIKQHLDDYIKTNEYSHDKMERVYRILNEKV